MGWFTGLVLYLLIWWVVLFAVLPFGIRSQDKADPGTGAPARPRMLMKACATTLIAAVIWVGVYALVRSPYLSFRDGILAMPIN